MVSFVIKFFFLLLYYGGTCDELSKGQWNFHGIIILIFPQQTHTH